MVTVSRAVVTRRPMHRLAPTGPSKLARLHAVRRTAGIRGVAELAAKNPPLVWFRTSWWRRLLRDERLWARWVELRGDRVRIEGCRFRVGGTAAIPTRRKSLFTRNRYEIEERRALAAHLDPELPVVELGGSIGVVACIVNRRLITPERHVVVEPNPDVVPILEENRRRNDARFEIVPKAVAYCGPSVTFRCRDFLDSGIHGDEGRAVEVPTTSFAAIVATAGFERCTLICDIEGEEIGLVAEEADALRRHADMLVIETHPSIVGTTAIRDMFDRLAEVGFESVFCENHTWVLRSRARRAARSCAGDHHRPR